MLQLKKAPIEMPWGKLTHDSVINKLRPYLPQLANEDLVLLCSVYPIDAYRGAFTVLRNRMEQAHPGRRESKEVDLDSAFNRILSDED
jgi:hypothetical protein